MIFERICEMIRSIGISDEVSPEIMLVNDLGMDSTELADLSTAIAKEFGVLIKSGDMKGYSVARIVEIIAKNKKGT